MQYASVKTCSSWAQKRA